MATEVIHGVGYAAHNDVSLLCAAPLTFCRLPVTVREGVYEGDDGVLYSFDKRNTSCVTCLQKQVIGAEEELKEARKAHKVTNDLLSKANSDNGLLLKELRTAHAMMWELLVWIPLAPMADSMRERTTTFLKGIKDLVKR